MKDTLNAIIKDNNLSIRKFSEMLDVSRAYIQSILKGDKPLSPSTLNKILELDVISIKQKTLLKKAFFKQQNKAVDTDLIEYFLNKIQQIQNVGEDLNTSNQNKYDSFDFSSVSSVSLNSKADITEICTYFARLENQVSAPILYTNYPADFTELEDSLYSVLCQRDYNKPYDFCKLATISNTCNEKFIDDTYSILRWAKAQLKVAFDFRTEVFSSVLMPYYVIFSNAVITFDKDYSNGICYLDKETINLYLRLFDKAKNNYHSSSVIFENELALMVYLRENTVLKYTIDCCGSMGPWLDYEVLDRVAHNELEQREYLIQAVINHYSILGKESSHTIFQSKNTLNRFLDDGEFRQITHRFIDTIPVDMRVHLFENMLKAIEDGTASIEIFNDSKFKAPENLFVESYNNSIGLEYVYSDKENKGSNALYSSAFFISTDDVYGLKDFLNAVPLYLVTCDYTVSQDNLKRIVSDLIVRGKFLK